ncbi:MAG: purine-nucleoside phosphorylase [Hydrogenoanaerobacterium sp.]
MNGFTYDFYKESADYILSRIKGTPEVALILGSGLSSLADEISDQIIIDYKDIPNFLRSTVQSHKGQLIFGKLEGKCVVCMSGRFHFYEGYDFEQLAAPVRVLKLIGAKKVILTNAAGAVNTSFKVGDIMIINDHIKLMGASPMRGANIEEFGERFFDVSTMYTPRLRKLAADCAKRLGQESQTREGVYYFYTGPQFETPAEIRAIRTLGGDAVGMSTVTEALTAAHCGMELLGLSIITNMAAGVLPQKLSDEEVGIAAKKASGRFKALLREAIKEL